MKFIPSNIRHIFSEFSAVEKVIFTILSFFLMWSAAMLFYGTIDSFRKDAPAKGGELHEGVVGHPNFINPLLSTTDTGRDLAYLTYSGLMKVNEKGEIVPDLAESYAVSEDGLTYTFKLRNNLVFHDNVKITSADVAFTVMKVKDARLKSPLATNWQGVTVRPVDEHTIEMTLKTPYTPFIENATLGILPEHIWKDADLDQFTFGSYNFQPIGSGPYKVEEIKRGADGAAEYYKLVAFSGYGPGEKYISTIYLHIYSDTASLLDALRKGEIESATGMSSGDAKTLEEEGYRVETADMLRIFGVFFNQNQATHFADKKVRVALSKAVDKKAIIDKVLNSYANEENSPLPNRLSGGSQVKATTTNTANVSTSSLSFTLTTSNNPELVATAELLKEQWAAIGAKVTIASLDPAELNQTVIRPRKYDALLFGEIVGRGNDLYPFWYSGERKDPGLNIALYTNARADSLLQKARTATSSEEIAGHLAAFEAIIEEDVPAIFLYSPDFLYVVPKKLKGLTLPPLELPTDRWAGIFASYINARRVWK
jgi:peptide/nickel transport system substrate-binding protein